MSSPSITVYLKKKIMFRITIDWRPADSIESVVLNSIGELSGTITNRENRNAIPVTIDQRVRGTREFVSSYVLCDRNKLQEFFKNLYT